MLKYSRQREIIKQNLAMRCDHPTAEMVYTDIRKEYPNISLGTVYRNLTLLSDLGEILKLSTGIGPDRFDGKTSLHSHFICRTCGKVIDVTLKNQELLNKEAEAEIPGEVESSNVYFYGICRGCQATS